MKVSALISLTTTAKKAPQLNPFCQIPPYICMSFSPEKFLSTIRQISPCWHGNVTHTWYRHAMNFEIVLCAAFLEWLVYSASNEWLPRILGLSEGRLGQTGMMTSLIGRWATVNYAYGIARRYYLDKVQCFIVPIKYRTAVPWPSKPKIWWHERSKSTGSSWHVHRNAPPMRPPPSPQKSEAAYQTARDESSIQSEPISASPSTEHGREHLDKYQTLSHDDWPLQLSSKNPRFGSEDQTVPHTHFQ